ncbi:MAG: flavin reductase family protein [Dehalococcoidia bacterium]|nr:flavin reductase family protein [Dehalococcoidia bacterium]
MTKKLLEQPDIYATFPTPIALVSCADQSGKGNILTLAWVGKVCTEPPMVSISMRQGKYSADLIRTSGEFVLNVPTESLMKETDYCGSVSGKDVDKWEQSGLTPAPAARVKAPLIAQSPINLECVVKHIINLGSHNLFVGEIVAIHVEQGMLKDGKIDTARVRPLVYFCQEFWGLSPDKLFDRKPAKPKG